MDAPQFPTVVEDEGCKGLHPLGNVRKYQPASCKHTAFNRFQRGNVQHFQRGASGKRILPDGFEGGRERDLRQGSACLEGIGRDPFQAGKEAQFLEGTDRLPLEGLRNIRDGRCLREGQFPVPVRIPVPDTDLPDLLVGKGNEPFPIRQGGSGRAGRGK